MYSNFYIIHYTVIGIFVCFASLVVLSSNYKTYFTNNKKNSYSSLFWILLFCLCMALFLGGRPSSEIFGDTQLYVGTYQQGLLPYTDEPIFNALSKFCMTIGMSSQMYLTIIALLYITLPVVFFYRKTNAIWIGFLFFVSSFSFLGYGVNGIRNGLAASVFILSFCFINNNRVNIKGLLSICFISFLSIGIHKSLLMPFGCLILSIYCLKDIKSALYIWFASIPISLVFGTSLSSVFMNLGYDDRLDEYLGGGINSHGFRWDFVIYSIIPIIIGVGITKKKIKVNLLYKVLLNTYILCNALWIMIIRANFSNRFAYLSWFLYPLVIYYPIFHFRIWRNQHVKCSMILFAYYAFTFTMYLIGK